ncbi:MAG: Holo-[acyl-carrier-protein] synthase [Candidatus Kapaibacterium sp.]|nr:MAG: Holo-[acyl-carrier-protein] synthase [Candidatus Kapabacteria bacterium]
MIVGVGIDIIEVDRIKKAIENYGERFLKRVFTEKEIEYCEEFKESKWVHYAVRFSAKEAFSKAIGTGLTQGFKLNEVGIKNSNNGKPEVDLYGELLEKWGKYKIFVSLSHINTVATAIVIIEI